MPKSPRFSPNPIRVIDVLTYAAVQLLDVTGRFRSSPPPISLMGLKEKIVVE